MSQMGRRVGVGIPAGLIGLAMAAVSVVHADVKITLRNGRAIIADTCREQGALYHCQRENGQFDIPKTDIVKMQQGTFSSPSESAVKADEPGEGRDKTEAAQETKTALETKAAAGAAAGKAAAATQEQDKRIDTLEMQRALLAAERDKLMQDREKLHEEVKAAGMIRSREILDSLQKKIEEMDTRVKDFNVKVEQLNSQISALQAELKKKW